jgi:hypothetical protein
MTDTTDDTATPGAASPARKAAADAAAMEAAVEVDWENLVAQIRVITDYIGSAARVAQVAWQLRQLFYNADPEWQADITYDADGRVARIRVRRVRAQRETARRLTADSATEQMITHAEVDEKTFTQWLVMSAFANAGVNVRVMTVEYFT